MIVPSRARRVLIGIAPLAVMIALCAYSPPAAPLARAGATGVTLASLAGPANCLTCSQCPLSSAVHVAPADLNGLNSAGSHSNCIDLPGCPHPRCGQQAMVEETEAISGLLADASRGNRAAMRTLLIDHQTRVTFNAARQSIQASGCNGGIIANVPLSEQDVASIGPVIEAMRLVVR